MTRPVFEVSAVFDTETTTVGSGLEARAFPCLYIVNDLCGVPLAEYEADVTDDVRFYRTSAGFVGWVEHFVGRFEGSGRVPIVCAYNLAFDLHTVLKPLAELWDMRVLAQSRTGFYSLDLLSEGEPVLRFWDTFYLEMGGLAAMGETCGFPKAVGDWDYSLVRHAGTPLSDAELNYAKRDVQVIPAYLKWLLQANDHLRVEDLGVRCLTKTSVVRLLAARTIGSKTSGKSNVMHNFRLLCRSENSPDFRTYALRKTAFRGGLTFTAGANSSQLWENVASFDVVSMHHAFINGRLQPVKFAPLTEPWLGELVLRKNREKTVADLLANYHQPFDHCFNIRVRCTNVRPREGSVFARAGIGVLPESKFVRVSEKEDLNLAEDVRNIMLINNAAAVVGDRCRGARFVFSKLVSADEITVAFTELEYWCFERCYEYDSLDFVEGEATAAYVYPPPFVSCASNMLFEQKETMKRVLEKYREGEPYSEPGELVTLPEGIAAGVAEGRAEYRFLASYYRSTVKGAFNSIYGMMAQDIYKPDFIVNNGEVDLVRETMPSEVNYKDRTPALPKVLYTYGARIVGGSRLHLVLAILLIDEALGERVRILGGDTDSLKIALRDCEPSDILEALEPLHEATRTAIDKAQARIREQHPEYASDLKDVGVFEHEGTASLHVELWNKGRVYWDGEKVHVTLAGVPRPKGVNIESCLNAYAAKHGPRAALTEAVGYNLDLSPAVSRYLGVIRPPVGTIFEESVTDHLGTTEQVSEYAAVALYASTKEVGSTLAQVNADNVAWLNNHGIYPDLSDKRFRYHDGKIFFSRGDEEQEL